MTWPTTAVDTTALDADGDSPLTARSAIKQMADNVNTMKDGRGAASGVASLDASSLVPVSQLPTVTVAKGGTGKTSVTAGSLLVGAGTSAMTEAAPGASGNVLTSNGTTWASAAPTFGIPAGSVIAYAAGSPPSGYLECNGANLSRSTYADLFAAIGIRHNDPFTASTSDTLTVTAHPFTTADAVTVAAYDGGVLPTGLTQGTTYYARDTGTNTVTLHATAGDATANTNRIDLTSAGSGNLRIAAATTFMVPDLRGEFIRGWDNGRGVDSGRMLGEWQNHLLDAHTHTVSRKQSPIDPAPGTAALLSTSAASDGNFTTNSSGGAETRPRNVALMYCIKT